MAERPCKGHLQTTHLTLLKNLKIKVNQLLPEQQGPFAAFCWHPSPPPKKKGRKRPPPPPGKKKNNKKNKTRKKNTTKRKTSSNQTPATAGPRPSVPLGPGSSMASLTASFRSCQMGGWKPLHLLKWGWGRFFWGGVGEWGWGLIPKRSKHE